MPEPPMPDAIYAALARLRDSDDALHPRHDPEYRLLDGFFRRSIRPGDPRGDDIVQRCLLTVARSVARMEAQTPGAALRWLRMIRRTRGQDATRATLRDPVARGIATSDEERGVEGLPASTAAPTSAEPIRAVFAGIEQEVERAAEGERARPSQTHLRRLQARAALHRLVLGAELEVLEEVLACAEPLTKERVYKWVERGREVVRTAAASWAARDPEMREVLEVLAEIVSERRADAGQARPARRRSGEEDDR